jgi:hypothetical protein
MDVNKAKDLLRQALVALDDAVTPAPTPVPVGSNLQALVANARDGAVFSLEAGNYTVGEGLILDKAVTLQTAALMPGGRRPRSWQPVWLTGSGDATVQHRATGSAQGATLRGIGVRNLVAEHELVADTGLGLTLDRCLLLGDAQRGQHRGIEANGVGLTVRQCTIDDIFAIGRDTQAIMGWNGTQNLVVEDCLLSAAGEAVMFGGATAVDAAHNPQTIRLAGCTLSKKVAWYAAGAQIKTALELKNATHVIVQDCILEYAGTAEGQGAYLIVLTPRNQDGDTPWATVGDVLIERCVARFGGGCVNFLGTDSEHPSGPLDGVALRNVLFDHIDSTQVWKGSGRCFQFGDAPRHVTLDGLTVRGANLAASGYFYGAPPVGLRVRNVITPETTYGMKIDGGGMGLAAVRAYAPDAVFELAATDTGASGYPVPA